MKKIIYIILFLISSTLLWSKETRGTIVDYMPLENGDTLKTTRWYGDWWFGVNAGGMYEQYIGNYYLPANINESPDPNPAPDKNVNPEFEFSPFMGFGYTIGLMAEYNPVTTPHGGFISVNFLNRNFDAGTDVVNKNELGIGAKEERYQVESQIKYIDIRPAYRYDFSILNSYAFIGPGFEINVGQNSKHFKSFIHTGDIEQTNFFKFENIKTRIYFHLGIGLDLLLADMGSGRLRFSPFVTADIGTPILEKQSNGLNEANLNVSQLKLGFALKFGPDNKAEDTLKLDPDYRGPEYESLDVTENIDLEANLNNDLLAAADVGYIPLPEPVEIVREEPSIQQQQEKREFEEVGIETNKMEIFTYPSSDATSFTPMLEEYLNSLANFMKENPGSEVRVVGHSDNLGTPEQNQRRSVIRKDKIVRYLLSKGIDRYRILDRGEGDRRPIATNRTEEGRQKNRRVEITVVQ